MPLGTVSWFSTARGLGFIKSDDGCEHFVRAMEVEMPGFRTLESGQRVSFDLAEAAEGDEASAEGGEDRQGLEAVRVRVLSDQAASEGIFDSRSAQGSLPA